MYLLNIQIIYFIFNNDLYKAVRKGAKFSKIFLIAFLEINNNKLKSTEINNCFINFVLLQVYYYCLFWCMELDFKSALKRIENSISYVEIKFRKMNGELRTGFFKKYKKTQTKQETFALNNTKEFHSIKHNALSLLIEKETNKVINIKVHLITQIKIGTKWVDII